MNNNIIPISFLKSSVSHSPIFWTWDFENEVFNFFIQFLSCQNGFLSIWNLLRCKSHTLRLTWIIKWFLQFWKASLEIDDYRYVAREPTHVVHGPSVNVIELTEGAPPVKISSKGIVRGPNNMNIRIIYYVWYMAHIIWCPRGHKMKNSVYWVHEQSG